jgi:phosphohistidine phosphatase
MKLYLVQHGEAKSEAEDPERSLTIKGEEEVHRVAKAAKRLDIWPSKIYHSGKRRARQTAEIVAQSLNLPAQAVQGLNPLDDIRPWVEQISKETEDLMIIGHLPFLEKLTSFLLCGDEKARLVSFRYGAVVCLVRKEDKGWAVSWILMPEMV